MLLHLLMPMIRGGIAGINSYFIKKEQSIKQGVMGCYCFVVFVNIMFVIFLLDGLCFIITMDLTMENCERIYNGAMWFGIFLNLWLPLLYCFNKLFFHAILINSMDLFIKYLYMDILAVARKYC